MKKNYVFLLVLFGVLSCQSPTSKYEKLIAQYAQTNKNGTFTDCQFEAIEIKELPPITVADSIKILETEFNKEKERVIDLISSGIKLSEDNLAKEEQSRYKLAPVIDRYKKMISRENIRLDSIKNTHFINIYESQSTDTVLSQPVECHYSYILQASSPRQERTDVFYFTPDLQRITKQVQVKKK